MTRNQLFSFIKSKESFLCVGLDPDLARLPESVRSEEEPVLAFLEGIINATKDYCVAYKPNLAFFEALGEKGWEIFAKTVQLIPDTHMIIADAKRGDIGNTARKYAQAFFDEFGCDALTVAPYMGHDSVTPFLESEGKWTVLLGLTSNPGSQDFQHRRMAGGVPLYELVVREATTWGTPDQLMFVVGATQGDSIQHLRTLAPDYFFLVPGVGAQGGDLETVARLGMNDHCGLLVNASRSILYASSGEDFADAAGQEAKRLQQEMKIYLGEYLLES
ncbi:MAG TPA: orotidine-5'-phosphate decarboxylase [Cytophagales bacterium]|nr:orotidine-5'-phosphate decarboxylase [Cytophagales bacterium]HAA19291.1 orotidine-5'-phosphate decarboxylase [Cytophagales bacterium]HAP61191.1 orotidine-5'-phosphate decarboxylase [Cytophagales bacterium]